MLHIHNGDSAANVLKESGLPGEHLVWRESLISGPTPVGLSRDEWANVRAHFLATAYGLDAQECRRGLLAQAEALANFRQHDEVILWFEHDLFCQTMLIYLLAWFAQKELGTTKLSLICISEFQGVKNFKGLGQLTPAQMASLFDTRHAVTTAELNLAGKAWAAYCSPTPKHLEELLAKDNSALPFIKGALRKHLARFPSVRNGLGCVENNALVGINAGSKDFISLFKAFSETESLYGLGDAQFMADLSRLHKADTHILEISNNRDNEVSLKSEDFIRYTFELTAAGRAVLAGEADFISLNGVDLWLGGTHLQAQANLWRWDEQTKTIEEGA